MKFTFDERLSDSPLIEKIVFKHGTFLLGFQPKELVDHQGLYLPTPGNSRFWFEQSAWEIPSFENADTFVEHLVREGLLVHDADVQRALQGEAPALSPRALQYRFLRSTGLTQKAIQQIERAQQAYDLLQQGTAIAHVAADLGYFDQSHLTNALKRFFGQTPAEIARGE